MIPVPLIIAGVQAAAELVKSTAALAEAAKAVANPTDKAALDMALTELKTAYDASVVERRAALL